MNVYQNFKIREGKLTELKKKEDKSIIVVVHLNTHLWKINGTPLKLPTQKINKDMEYLNIIGQK